MRIKQDDFFARLECVVEMVFVLIMHEFAQPVGRRVPIQSVFEHQLRHVLKMAFEHGFAFVFAPFGKAFFEVGFADFAARFDGIIGKDAHCVGNFVYGFEGQELDEVEEEKGGFHVVCSGMGREKGNYNGKVCFSGGLRWGKREGLPAF